MGDPASQLPDRFHLLRLEQRASRLLKFLLSFASVADVPSYLRKSYRLAPIVADRIDDHMGPELRPIFANPPALVLPTTFTCGRLQADRGQAGGAILGGVELGEVLSNHLIDRIALDPFSAGVPARNAAGRVEHIYRIVSNALDQQTELFLGSA